jgi:predicted nucleic acid-binding protein
MQRVFADTFYWIALLYRRDPWHLRVSVFDKTLLDEDIVFTTDAVFTELLAPLIAAGPYVRQEAVRLVEGLLDDTQVRVVEGTRALFLEGLTLYRARPDKAYSLTDCLSMQVMRREGLTDVLTHDRHFMQEGFHILFE